MARRIPTIFDAFEFEEQELEFAKLFSDANLLYLKTLRAEAVHAKLELKFDPSKQHEFVGNSSYFQGKIDALSLLIGD